MTLGEELCRKYLLTSLKAQRCASVTLLAINEAIEAAAGIADQEHSPIVANRIRSLKWIDNVKDAVACTDGRRLLAPNPWI